MFGVIPALVVSGGAAMFGVSGGAAMFGVKLTCTVSRMSSIYLAQCHTTMVEP